MEYYLKTERVLIRHGDYSSVSRKAAATFPYKGKALAKPRLLFLCLKAHYSQPDDSSVSRKAAATFPCAGKACWRPPPRYDLNQPPAVKYTCGSDCHGPTV